ncbi:MAG: tandem-95 repeat protein, partial [Candidatus Neomarinimicrobiota bacterium]
VADDQSVTTDEDVAVDITLSGDDIDGDDLTFQVLSEPENGELTGSAPSLTYTPNANFHGSDSFTFQVSDGSLEDAGTVTITVGSLNDPPLARNDAATTNKDTPVIVYVLANDGDPDGDDLAVASVTQADNGAVEINPDGSVTYTPNENFSGSDSFTYTISDGKGGLATATVTVYVNIAAGAVSVKVGPEGGTVETEIGATLDIPDGALSVPVEIVISRFDVPPDGADLAGLVYFFGPSGIYFDVPVTITVAYDPQLIPPGLDAIRLALLRYNESDGTWDVLPGVVDTVAHTVSGQTDHFCGFAAGFAPNQAPQVIQSLPDVSIAEDTPYATLVQKLGDYFSDLDTGDRLTFSATALDEGLATLIISQELDLIAIPGENFFGAVRIVVSATDDWSACVSDTLLLTVTPVNDPPFMAHIPDIYLQEDHTARLPLTAYDVEGDALTFSATSDTSAVTTAVEDTILQVVPAADWNGTARIMVSVSDGLTTQRDTFAITVAPVGDPPLPFSLLAPANAAIIQLQPADLGDSLTFAWDEAVDPDNDPVRYAFLLSDSGSFSFEYGDTTVNKVRLSYADILAVIRDQGLNSVTFWWTITAISKEDTTEASNGPYSLTIDTSTLAVADAGALPQFFILHQNYPNPFNPVTTLKYELPSHSRVLLVIYDMRGREVVRLVDGYVPAGYNKVVWNSSDSAGRPVSTGVYFARLITPAYTHTIKMTLLR